MSIRFVLEDHHRFSFPHEVVDDPALSITQKREILSEWASDACAVASFPTLRQLPGTTFPVTFSSIMDARAELDRRTYMHGEDDKRFRREMGRLVVADFARRAKTDQFKR
jgi:hypothetical protein